MRAPQALQAGGRLPPRGLIGARRINGRNDCCGMKTPQEALGRLEQRGLEGALLARLGGLLGGSGDDAVAPEEFMVNEVVRFEGEIDPGDEPVLFSMHSMDGRARGTFVASYRPHAEPDCAAVIRRLRLERTTDKIESSSA